ncbi:hypothetical protein HanIR_Chr06g0272651 [Helianthus annuus]|nr:hypothetical protein HanIR_Chr06g0272651 [Helianthus annuus]
MTRRPDRPAAGPTTGPMLKRLKQADRPALVSGSRPDRSGFKNIGQDSNLVPTVYHNTPQPLG